MAELRLRSGVVPHTGGAVVEMAAPPGTGTTAGGGGRGLGGGGGGEAAGTLTGVSAPRCTSSWPSAIMAADTLRRPPVMVLSAASGTLSTLLMIRLFRSA